MDNTSEILGVFYLIKGNLYAGVAMGEEDIKMINNIIKKVEDDSRPIEPPVKVQIAESYRKTLIEKAISTYKKEAGIIKNLTAREEILISICYNIFNNR